MHFQLPRRTVRLRLTLLYGGLFLLSGIGLLSITYLLVRHATEGVCLTNGHSGVCTVGTGSTKPLPGKGAVILLPGRGSGSKGADRSVPPLTRRQLQAQAAQLRAQAQVERDEELRQLLIQSGVALAIMAVVSVGLGWVVAGRVLRPLRTLTAAVQDISASNLHERLALGGTDDELKELGNTFNGLLDRLERSFTAQRQFVANASHELRTPLARQRTLLEVGLSDPRATVESLRAMNQRALAAGEQQERLIEALLTLARSERGLDRHEPFDLAAIAHEIVGPRRREAESRGLAIHAFLESAPSSGDPRLAERLVANLVDNALRHNVTGGRIQVRTVLQGGRAVVEVANDGPVIAPAEVERLFQPFQRLGTERTGHAGGSGLGLSIVRAIAQAHDATLTARPRLHGGLQISVGFPAGEGSGVRCQVSGVREIVVGSWFSGPKTQDEVLTPDT
jgi:signal transduction histidine kinase